MGVVQNKIDIKKLEKILSNGISDGKMIYKPLVFDIMGYNIKVNFTTSSNINLNGNKAYLLTINPETFEIVNKQEISQEELLNYNFTILNLTTFYQLKLFKISYNAFRDDGLIDMLVVRADVDNTVNTINLTVNISVENLNIESWGFFTITNTLLSVNDVSVDTTDFDLEGYETAQSTSTTHTLINT